ncbi:hypothetical protein V6N13_107016 [Hibiscus sabdariffa]|uniref:Uncharacterized protein n=1 Tax=Hibiscus sabdariffa TaxID=183260 RepID=A0ABR2F2H8_9ROSI
MADTIDSQHQTHHSDPSFQSLFHLLDPIPLILPQHHMMERGPRYRAYADLRENKLRMKFEMLQEWEDIQLKQLESTSIPVKPSSLLMQSVPDFSSTLLKENRKPSVTGGIESTPPRTAKNWSKAKGAFLNPKQKRWEETEFKQTPTKKQVKFSSNSGVSNKGPSVLAQSVPDFSASLWKENRKPAVMGRTETTPPSTGKNWSNSIGSKSANSGEKKKGRLVMMRKSYASVEEMKAINGGRRGGKSSARLF